MFFQWGNSSVHWGSLCSSLWAHWCALSMLKQLSERCCRLLTLNGDGAEVDGATTCFQTCVTVWCYNDWTLHLTNVCYTQSVCVCVSHSTVDWSSYGSKTWLTLTKCCFFIFFQQRMIKTGEEKVRHNETDAIIHFIFQHEFTSRNSDWFHACFNSFTMQKSTSFWGNSKHNRTFH